MSNESAENSFSKEVQSAGGLSVLLGILVIFSGVIAMTMPVLTTWSVSTVAGWALIVGGGFSVVAALRDSIGLLRIIDTILGAVTVLAGLLIVTHPSVGIIAVTTAAIIWFLVRGFVELGLVFQPTKHRLFLAVAAAIDLFLGFSLMSLDPGPRAAAVGTFVGISLVFWGASLAAFGGSVRSLGRELENV